MRECTQVSAQTTPNIRIFFLRSSSNTVSRTIDHSCRNVLHSRVLFSQLVRWTLNATTNSLGKRTLLSESIYNETSPSHERLENRGLLLLVEDVDLALVEDEVHFFFDLSHKRRVSSGSDQVLSNVCVDDHAVTNRLDNVHGRLD